jgi:hypothetical protein
MHVCIHVFVRKTYIYRNTSRPKYYQLCQWCKGTVKRRLGSWREMAASLGVSQTTAVQSL